MKRKIEMNFALALFFFWVTFAVVAAFASSYLLGRGISSTGVGLITAFGTLAAALLQPAAGSLMDVRPALTGRRMSVFVLLLLSGLALVIYLLKPDGLVLALLYALLIMLLYTLEPLVNIFGVDCMNTQPDMNYSLSRSFGSVGYALCALFLGILLESMPLDTVPGSAVLFSLMTALIIFLSPLRTVRSEAAARREASSNPFVFLKKYPAYRLMLLALIPIYFSHMMLNTFALQIVREIGGDNAEMGIGTAIAALAETVTVAVFTKLLLIRFRIPKLLCFSALFFCVKALVTLIAWNIPSFYFAQFLQIFAWGIMTVANIYYVKDAMRPEDLAKGQAYLAMTHTVGSLLGAAVGGRIIDAAGVKSMLILATALGAVGFVIMCAAMKKGKTAAV